jgi:Fur family zinc uptake transcriptional regulator
VDYCKAHLDEVIPVMSVYRILHFLQAQGLAHKLGVANKYVACSGVVCENQHELSQFLICNQCQRVEKINIDSSLVKRLQGAIHKTGFHLSSPQLELSGVCGNCV